MRKRGFEVAKGYEDKGINLPLRATRTSAGFDFEAAEDVWITPLWRQIVSGTKDMYVRDDESILNRVRPQKVFTGIKAYMGDDEVLFVFNRSSNPFKRFLLLADGVGVIDSDYYNNPTNDGNIFLSFINFGLFTVKIKKGERIGQGVFHKFLDADDGKARKSKAVRLGGSGTT